MSVLNPEQPKYPHLENLDRHPEFLTEAWASNVWLTVTEKLHGFNARFGKTSNGEFWVGSRNQVVEDGRNLQGFYEWAQTRARETPASYTYFGEWVGKSVQKGIDYGDEKRFYLFAVSDWSVREGYNFLPQWNVEAHAHDLMLDLVPVYYDDLATGLTTEMLIKMRNMPSNVAYQAGRPDQQQEGIVISPYPAILDDYGHPLIIKYKNFSFKNVAESKKPPPDADVVAEQAAFVMAYVTKTRIREVLDHLLPVDGKLVENTGIFLKEFYEDCVREGEPDFGKLTKEASKGLGKAINRAVKPLLQEVKDES